MLAPPTEVVACRPAAVSSTAYNPCAAPSSCSAAHAAVPSPPPTPRTAPAAGFAADSRSATLLIAGLVAINHRVTLSFHGTCPTLLLSAASSHARLPKAHGDLGGSIAGFGQVGLQQVFLDVAIVVAALLIVSF